MALYRDIKFNLGSAACRFGAVPTIIGSTFSKKEKGYAIETGFNKQIQYDRQLIPNGAFSVVVWAKLSVFVPNTTNFQVIGAGVGGATPSVDLNFSGVQYPIIYLGSTNYKYFTSYTFDTNWHCFIFTIPGNAQTDITTSQFFVDTISKAGTSVSTGTQSARTGMVYAGGGNASTNVCQISRIKVYDHVLSTNEINTEQTEFNNAQPITKPIRGFVWEKPTDLSRFKGTGVNQGLIAAYNMKPIGNTLVDISGNGNNGICSNVINTKNGLSFNGVNSVISITSTNYGKIHSFLIKLNLKQIKDSGIFTQGSAANYIRIIDATHIYVRVNSGTVIQFTIPTLTINVDYTFIFIRNNTTYNLYINGIQQGGVLTLGNNDDFIISNIGGYSGTYINGEIADIRIHNRILSPTEIKAYANSFVKLYINEDFSSYAVGETI